MRASPDDPALGPVFALSACAGVGLFALLLAVVGLLFEPEPLPPPLDLGVNQQAESALYLISFGLLVPLSALLGPRIAGRVANGPSADALGAFAAVATGGLASAVLAARLLSGGAAAVLGLVGLWWLFVAALWWLLIRPRPVTLALLPARHTSALWVGAGLLVLASLLAFGSVRSIALIPFAVLLLAAAALTAYVWRGRRLAGARLGRWAPAVDALVVLLLVSAIPDLAVLSGDGARSAYTTYLAKFHQNFVLGPANYVLDGGALLVDSASQYGIGSVYFVTAWSLLAPLGYGTFALLDAALVSATFAASYALLRLAKVSRPLGAGALALGVIALVYNLEYPVGNLPQHGPLRFGLPLVVVLASVLGAARPRRAALAQALRIGVVGLASVWAFEAFVYTLATALALLAFEAALIPRGDRRAASLVRQVAWMAGACVAAHLLLVLLTLALSSRLPDYGWYLAFLKAFLFDRIGDITYDFAPWSPGPVVGVGYALSALALLLHVRRRADVVATERAAFTALVGLTVYGAALFSYLVNRSLDEIIPYISLPLLLTGALWLSLILRGSLGGSRAARAGGLGFGLALTALVAAAAFSSIPLRLPDSALASALPGGRGLRADLGRLWRLPPTDRRVPQGQRLVQRFQPGRGPALVVLSPPLEAEILLRTRRVSALGFSYPMQDQFIAESRGPEIDAAVARLRPGQRLLTQYRPTPGNPLVPLQQRALRAIRARFALRELHRDPQGYVVFELGPRR